MSQSVSILLLSSSITYLLLVRTFVIITVMLTITAVVTITVVFTITTFATNRGDLYTGNYTNMRSIVNKFDKAYTELFVYLPI